MTARKTANPETPKVVALTSKKERTENRVNLFSIDGTDYSMPTSIRPNQGLKIMDVMRKQGSSAGTSYMLEALLGVEGYTALLSFDDLQDDELEKIIEIAFEVVAGSTPKS